MRFSMGFGSKQAWPALARIAVASVIALASIAALALCSATTAVGETLTTFGGVFAELTGAQSRSGVGRLSINGLDVNYMTATTPLTVDEALDRVQHMCSEHGGLNPLGLLLDSKHNKHSRRAGSLLRGVLRNGGKSEGTIACLDTGTPLNLPEFVRRLRLFAKNGDLSALGEFRYALMRREGKGTSLLVLWSEGKAPLLQMFPPTGDAPGTDPVGVPRPDHTTRLLATSLLGSPYEISVYRAPERSPSDLRRWYDEQLTRLGWWTLDGGSNQLIARRNDQTIVVRIGLEATGSTVVSVARLS
jgi:hypothetical protein